MAVTLAQPPARRDLPDGYVAIPISLGQRAAPVRIAVVVRLAADAVAGHLVDLRQTAEARVFLGALIDVGGRVHAWLELWVQDLDAPGRVLPAWRDGLTNAVLDQRWQRNAELAWANDAVKVVRTGWESRHPVPVWLDVGRGEPVSPTDPTGEAWRLCQDDAVLAAAGLPPYSGSLHRYLYLPKKGADAGFVPATPEAPTNDRARPADLPLAGRTDLVPFNPGGGLLLVRELVGPSLETYLDLLAGGPADGPVIRHGRTPIHLFGSAPGPLGTTTPPGGTTPDAGSAGGGDGGGWLLAGRAGGNGRRVGAGRLLESLHLRLRALADVATAVRDQSVASRTPLLNVDPSRFQVRLGETTATGLPAYWAARAVLVEPGDAVAVPVDSAPAAYFLPARPLPPSAYRAMALGAPAEAAGEVRIEQSTESAAGLVVTGTVVTAERLVAGPHDLLRLRLPLGAGRTTIHATADRPDDQLASRELPFRSFPTSLASPAADQLKAAAGATLQAATVEVVPYLGADWDLYSVGVVGVRALLVNGSNGVGAAVGELATLAARAAADPSPDDPLADRIGRAWTADPRHARALGPHRLAWGEVPPERAAAAVPPELWWGVLAALAEAVAGVGCRRPPSAGPPDWAADVARAFGPFLASVDALLIRTQSLFVPDWDGNREVRAVIDKLMEGGDAAGGAEASGV